jgi:hypothetical protein
MGLPERIGKSGLTRLVLSATENGTKDNEMRAFQILKNITFASLLIASVSNAGPVGYDPILKEKKLEAGAPCADGSCYHFDRDGGLAGVEAQVHKINTFSSNGSDPLVKVTKQNKLKEFDAIGKIKAAQPVPWPDGRGGVYLAKGVQSTAFLISPCLVMTNYHSVFGVSTAPNKTDFSVTFTANRTVIGKPVFWRRQNGTTGIGKDLVIVQLEDKDCLGSEVGFIKMLEEPLSDLKDRSLLTAGYPAKKEKSSNPNQLWAHFNCQLQQGLPGPLYKDTIFNDCATSAGQSGSPLLVRNNSGDIRFIGAQAAELGSQDRTFRKFDSRNGNVAVDLISALSLEELDLVSADVNNHKGKTSKMASK